MKDYSVYFKEPVPFTYKDQVWNKETRKWEEKEVTEMRDSFVFHSLGPAKKLIKANLDKYKGSCITKNYSNGDWENCGEIKLHGSNAVQMSDMKTKQY